MLTEVVDSDRFSERQWRRNRAPLWAVEEHPHVKPSESVLYMDT